MKIFNYNSCNIKTKRKHKQKHTHTETHSQRHSVKVMVEITNIQIYPIITKIEEIRRVIVTYCFFKDEIGQRMRHNGVYNAYFIASIKCAMVCIV